MHQGGDNAEVGRVYDEGQTCQCNRQQTIVIRRKKPGQDQESREKDKLGSNELYAPP